MNARNLFWCGVAAWAMIGAVAAAAESFPSKPITLVVTFAPGGQSDASARMYSEQLAKLLGQPVVIENRPGAAGNLGYGVVARGSKDGSNILVGLSSVSACNPALYNNLTWDPIKDFVPIGTLTLATHTIMVHPSVPATNLSEFIAYVKANPGKVAYASSGVGALSHTGAVMIQRLTGIDMIHVPYKGSGEVMKDLLGGRVQMAITTPPTVMGHIKSGQLRALAVTSMTRWPSLPDVPTANESGLPGYELEAWVGLFAPAGTPTDAVATLSNALKTVADMPETRQRAAASGLEIRYLSPDALAAKLRLDIETCTKTVKDAGIKVSD